MRVNEKFSPVAIDVELDTSSGFLWNASKRLQVVDADARWAVDVTKRTIIH